MHGTLISDSLGSVSLELSARSFEGATNPGWTMIYQNMDHIVHVRTHLANLEIPLSGNVRELLPISCNGVRVWRYEDGDHAVWCGAYELINPYL